MKNKKTFDFSHKKELRFEDLLTQSAKQTFKYFNDLVRKDVVNDFVLSVRESLGIGPKGIFLTEDDIFNIAFIKDFNEFRPDTDGDILDSVNFQTLEIQLSIFLEKYNLDNDENVQLMKLYVLYNEILPLSHIRNSKSNDLAWMEELPIKLFANRFNLEGYFEKIKVNAGKYPILLHINPNISQRQLFDFLKKNWALIDSYKNDKEPGFSSLRNRSRQKKDDFIYKNKHLPAREIMSLMVERFGDDADDYSYINKVKRDQKKKREEI